MTASVVCADEPAPVEPRLLVAFSSYRDRPKHPMIYFYRHDGRDRGEIVSKIPAPPNRVDYCASLSADGRLCAFSSELENNPSRVLMWDIGQEKLVELPAINDSPNAQLQTSLSGDGRLLTFSTWNRPNSSARWDVQLYDVAAGKLLLPGLNTQAFDEQMPAISGDNKWIAYVTNAKDSQGLSDIFLYDMASDQIDRASKANSVYREIDPALDRDGSLLAFVSNRPGGAGGRDIYLFDRNDNKLLPLDGLNSVAHEQSPSLSQDGRFIAFVSERISGEGERDVFIYDRTTKQLLSTPGLNSKTEDFDPCIIQLVP
jgi:Tol biopolymer transport system component